MKKLFVSLIIALSLVTVSHAVEPNEPKDTNDIQELKRQVSSLRRLNVARVKEIERLKTENQELIKKNIQLRAFCKENGIEPNEVSDLRKKKSTIGKQTKIQDRFISPMMVGQVAYLNFKPSSNIHLLEELQPNKIIGRIEITPDPVLVKAPDGGLMQKGFTTVTQTILFKGFSADDLKSHKKNLIAKVTGTDRYNDGSLFVLEPYDPNNPTR